MLAMIKHIQLILFFSIAFCFICVRPTFAQNIEIIDAVQEPFTPEAIIRNYFIGEGVDILDVSYEGINDATGIFSGGIQELGIDQGIVLATGKVDRFIRPHTNESSTLTSDEDIENQELLDIIGAELLKDIASYEITFIPSADTIQFNYVFASEEYPEYVCSEFNDVFGFFISGPNPAGGQYTSQNIAIVPGTTNIPVSINSVNNGMAGSSSNQSECAANANLNFSHLYNDNTSESLIFDGVLSPFSAAAKVIPCETYTIKFSIADVNDFLKDSAVFLEGSSFSSNTVEVKAVTTNANGTIVEGCESASIIFELPSILSQDEQVEFALLGTAENGVDFEEIPATIIIPAGQSQAVIEITPLEDNIQEEIESLGVILINGACLQDTIWVGIEDNSLQAPEDQGPVYLCDNLPDEVDYTVAFTPPSPTVFRNQEEIRIEPTFEPVFSTINVQNVFPSTLNQTDFIQVCIDELSHPWIDDLSIYLFGPNNQFIELTSKNGGNGGNGTMTDFYINTCFTFDATNLISDPSFTPPYIGQYQPEGDWDDFFGRNSFKVNGNWRLMMIDDFQGSVGTLHSWSIHFGNSYDVNYSWSPSNGISCTDCPNPTFDLNTSQTYTLDIEDTNGCSLSYDVNVIANDAVTPSPTLFCESTSMDSISFYWDEVVEAQSYEIRINGGAWENVGLALEHRLGELSQGESISIEVQAIGACDISQISTTSCSTGSCGVELIEFTTIEPECNIENSGFIQVNATGGTEPYTFSFGDVQNNTGIFENLVKGEHIILVEDANGCTDDITITIQGKEVILIDGIVDNIECGEETGSIDLSISGGYGQLNMVWSSNFTGNVNALPQGTYELQVTDENGCTAVQDFTINQVANFEADFDIVHPKCAGNNDGSISVSIDDPSLTVDILWSNGMTGTNIQNLSEGIYQVIITSDSDCELTREIELIGATSLSIDVAKEDNFCFGETQGFIAIEVEGGNGPYTINWSNNLEGNQIEGLSKGTYTANISDVNGCELIQDIVIEEPLELTVDELITEPSCIINTGTIAINPTGGTAPYMLSLNGTEFIEQTEFTNLSPGEYRFEVMDNLGCTIASDQSILLEAAEDINLVTESTISLSLGESALLTAFVTNRSENIEYVWEGVQTDNLSCIDCQNPIYTGFNSTSFTVSAFDDNGCQAVENVIVQVDNSADIYVPNAFSPNGDGFNEKLSVFAKSEIVSKIDAFSIYDRWGNQVFFDSEMEPNNQNHGWDGDFRGKALNQGVYIWNLQLTLIDGSTRALSGDVTLIK